MHPVLLTTAAIIGATGMYVALRGIIADDSMTVMGAGFLIILAGTVLALNAIPNGVGA